jgi:hypothetical protein
MFSQNGFSRIRSTNTATVEAATAEAGALPNAPELFHFSQTALNTQIMIL